MRRTNAKGKQEMYFCGKQMSIVALEDLEDIPCERSIRRLNLIHQLPEVEFHVSKVAHVTTQSGLVGILDSEGFQGHHQDLLWWSSVIEDEDLQSAEERLLEKTFPGRSASQKSMQKPFLSKFTTSPAFQMDKSRYGNFKFTFSLQDLLQMYGEQICGGDFPEMRVYGTTVYQQEIMYTVVVHSPSVKEFEKYPSLCECEDDSVFTFKNQTIVWQAQALSKTIHYKPVIYKERPNIIEVESFVPLMEYDRWFVWDHVTVAFHVPQDQTLRVNRKRLIQNLSACEAVDPFLGVRCAYPSKGCTCGCGRLHHLEAQRIVEEFKIQDRQGGNVSNQPGHTL